MKSRSVGNTSRQSVFNIPSKDTSPRCDNHAIEFLDYFSLVALVYSMFLIYIKYAFLADDMHWHLISAAREALVALSSSPPSVASTHSGSVVHRHTSRTANQMTAATFSVAESSAASNTSILDRSPTPPLLYPRRQPYSLAHIFPSFLPH